MVGDKMKTKSIRAGIEDVEKLQEVQRELAFKLNRDVTIREIINVLMINIESSKSKILKN